MFDNIGGKIKTVANIFCWLGIIGFAIYGIVCIVNGNNLNNDYYPPGTGNGLITAGWIILIAGPICSWLGSLGMYALGQITENSDTMVETLADIKKQLETNQNNDNNTNAPENRAAKIMKTAEKEEPKAYKPIPMEEREPTHAIMLDDGQEKCEKCGTVQRSGRGVCMECGARFMRDT